MEQKPKKAGREELSEAEEAKRQPEEVEMDGVEDDILAWLSADENTVAELMEVLDSEKSSPAAAARKVRFIANPYSSGLAFQTTPSSYVTINGNEESCGSSFSDWDSSVMASVDYSIGAPQLLNIGFEGLERWAASSEMDGAWGGREGRTGGANGSVSVKVVDGYDGLELDEDSLARFLGEIFTEQSVA